MFIEDPLDLPLCRHENIYVFVKAILQRKRAKENLFNIGIDQAIS